MKRLVILSLLAMVNVGISTACSRSTDCFFYFKVDSGISCSQQANIKACAPTWNQAVQGYNATLGHCPIAGFGIGCELFHFLDLECTISNRSIFEYRKCQTPITGGSSYVREFDLNATSILFSTYLLGSGIPYCNWDFDCGKIYPMLGAGVGGSHLLITNFRTTGLPPTGDSSPHSSFSTENQYTLRKNFTYILFAGFEYNYHDCWAIGTGYRWFNAGHFKGPRYFRVAGGSAVDVGCDAWKMRFRSNEWFIEFKMFI